jgi:hypothetical protein
MFRPSLALIHCPARTVLFFNEYATAGGMCSFKIVFWSFHPYDRKMSPGYQIKGKVARRLEPNLFFIQPQYIHACVNSLCHFVSTL